MATEAERKALLFFGAVLALGAGARAARVYTSGAESDAAGRQALETQIKAADSARHVKLRKSRGRRREAVPRPAAKVDLDIAGEPEIVALKGVGPSLARRIVANRDSFGPFGSLAGLRRVRGVGPALVAKLDSTVTFSLLPRPMNTVIPGVSARVKAPGRHRPKGRGRDSLR